MRLWIWIISLSGRLSITLASVLSQDRSHGMCGGQSGTGSGYHQVLWFPLPSFIPPTAPPSSVIQGWYNRPNNGWHTKWIQSHLTLQIKKKKKHTPKIKTILGWDGLACLYLCWYLHSLLPLTHELWKIKMYIIIWCLSSKCRYADTFTHACTNTCMCVCVCVCLPGGINNTRTKVQHWIQSQACQILSTLLQCISLQSSPTS